MPPGGEYSHVGIVILFIRNELAIGEDWSRVCYGFAREPSKQRPYSPFFFSLIQRFSVESMFREQTAIRQIDPT